MTAVQYDNVLITAIGRVLFTPPPRVCLPLPRNERRPPTPPSYPLSLLMYPSEKESVGLGVCFGKMFSFNLRCLSCLRRGGWKIDIWISGHSRRDAGGGGDWRCGKSEYETFAYKLSERRLLDTVYLTINPFPPVKVSGQKIAWRSFKHRTQGLRVRVNLPQPCITEDP